MTFLGQKVESRFRGHLKLEIGEKFLIQNDF